MRSPLVVAPMLLLLLPFAAAADADVIQPGDRISSEVGGCTMSFVYDGLGVLAGRTYVGTAAHCVGGLGSAISADQAPGFATLTFVDRYLDYALLEVAPSHAARISAEVKGHPGMPSGHILNTETREGDLLHFSGYGVGFSATQATRENRVGVLVSDNPREYRANAPIIYGDSGGPVLHASGKALGIVSRIQGIHDMGPMMQAILAGAAAGGHPVALRTA